MYRTFCLIVTFLFLVSGCLPSNLPWVETIPDDYEHSAEEFIGYLEVVVETENRAELFRMIHQQYSDNYFGREVLIERLDKIFQQFEIRKLSIEVEQIVPFNNQVTVKTHWSLTWQCKSSDPDQGCPEIEGSKSFPLKRRIGQTIFVLEWSDSSWHLQAQRGNVLLGLYEPGDPAELD